ncbi:hypothetical protein HYU23_03050 [Candidatus Woesearchaeota archaeon]|nr:hypothetical protein [Candidatus Woesearchaeota archaeon]
MKRNKLIQCWITSEQYERIDNITVAKGFLHISDYMRHALLDKDLAFETKFYEIHQALLRLSEEINKLKEK